MNAPNETLVGRLIGLAPMPPLVLALTVAALLLLPLLAMGAGPSAPPGLWRFAMTPALIAFILAIHPWLQGRWQRAVEALRPLARQPALIDQAPIRFRLGAWIAVFLGSALALWISDSTPIAGGLFAYTLTTSVALFSLMGLVIHDGLRRSRLLARVVAAGLELDLFDRQRLMPVARFGQGVSLAFVGGICLSLLFQSADRLYSLQALVIYTILVGVALTSFFSSIWSVHVALVAAQQGELAAVREQWRRARESLREHLAQAGPEEAVRLYHPLVVFATFERQVLEASTWPFNPKIVKEVGASVVAPVLIYGVKVAMGLSGSA